jgi:hypothetical protein
MRKRSTRSLLPVRAFQILVTLQIGMTLAALAHMLKPRIRQLADGEELMWSESDDCGMRPVTDDPREELLEHRRAAETALERALLHPIRVIEKCVAKTLRRRAV